MGKVLPRSFYSSDDVVSIAKSLLGKRLVHEVQGVRSSGIIVETEAYRAPDDKACHAYRNLRSPRTEIMFGKPGTSYVYLCYGIHHLFNVVTAPSGVAHAVLIRALEPDSDQEIMLHRRGLQKLGYALTNGPGKLTQALGITIGLNAHDLCEKNSILRIEESIIQIKASEITSGPRVGVQYAEECAHWPWRFRIKGHKWTSKPDRVHYPPVKSLRKR